mgnify:FL=1
MNNLFIFLNLLISFPVVVDSTKEEAAFVALILIIITTLAFILGFSLLIYIPIRFLYWLITKKPMSRIEKSYTITSLIFTALGLIIYYTL